MLGSLLLGSGAAHADTSSYLSQLQEEIPNVVARYGAQPLLTEGTRVCNWAAQGVPENPAGGIVDRIEADLPMSDKAAIALLFTAEGELGC